METEQATITTMNSNSHTLTRGNKQFELCNHLGNVLVTVQDRKRSADVNADNQADYYLPYLRTVTNYYAYGSAMPGIGGSIKECTVTSTNLTLKKYPYFHTFSNDSTSGFTAGSGARSVTNPTHNVLHLESIWTTRPLANKTIYLKNGVNYALKFNLAGFSVVSGYTHTVKVRILLPGNTLSYTYTATGNQTINFTSNTTGNVTVEISSQITGSGSYSINPYIDIDNFNLSWDSAYTAYVNNCGSNAENYKYGFNTQEKDNEIAGENNVYTAEFWEYDARIARRWNIDPVEKINLSSYMVLSGNPILRVDINGDDDFDKNGKLIKKTNDNCINIKYEENGVWMCKDITDMPLQTVDQRMVVANIADYYAKQLGIKTLVNGGVGAVGVWGAPYDDKTSVAFTHYSEKYGFGIWLNYKNNDKGFFAGLTNKYYMMNTLYHEKLHQDDMVEFKKTYTGDMSDFNTAISNSWYGSDSRHADIYLSQMKHFTFKKMTNDLQIGTIALFLAYNRIDADIDPSKAEDRIDKFNSIFKGNYKLDIIKKAMSVDKNSSYGLYDLKNKKYYTYTEKELEDLVKLDK